MRMRHSFTLCGALSIAFAPLLLAGSLRAQQAPAQSTVQAAYVLLAESPAGSTVAFARAIVDSGQSCPDLVGAGAERIPMTPRRNPHGFAVKVCEARYPIGRSLTVEGGPRLPPVVEAPSRIAVFGDSGCKPKDQDGCGLDDPQWPFPALARAAAASRPDLVLHVGDYNYRGTPSGFKVTVDGKEVQRWYYDAGDGASPSEQCGIPGPYYSQNSTGNPDADLWEAWWLDFFQPAGDLLTAAPWVFARGNHELCSHAGPGWFYFLDASSELPEGGGRQLACPSQDGEGPALPHLQLVEPQVLHLGDLDLLVVDSANACDQLPGLAEIYRRQLITAARRLRGRKAWLMTHRPIWGVADAAAPMYGCDGQPESGPALPYGELNRTLQCALRGEAGKALLPALEQILAGHMHRFEALSFAAPSGRPPVLVVGNSGVAEDPGPPVGAFAQTVDGAPASGFSIAQFGYLELAKDSGGAWHGSMVALDPAAWSPFLSPCAAPGAADQALCVKPATAQAPGANTQTAGNQAKVP
ncbi:MAG TPA: metallophosphoesterase [Thermoanaerobaculia bacterium]|nr:metallophosphoesterase [Thermoanaerobaculia bacterium]